VLQRPRTEHRWAHRPIGPVILEVGLLRAARPHAILATVGLRWSTGCSELEVRRALAAAMPGLEVGQVTLRPRHPQTDPLYWSSSAFVDDDLVVKFAWSHVRAVRLHREGVLLERLADRAPALRLPEVVALHDDPVVVVTRRVAGEPLSAAAASELRGARLEHVAGELADVLLALHALPATEVLRGLPDVTPTAQSDTDVLRDRYGRLVDRRRAALVHRWCDWVDHVLGAVGPEAVLVHGDLHGHNQLWDLATGALVAVLDLEECGAGDPHFDFRYLPGSASSTGVLLAVVDAYQRRSQARLSLERIMAWHVLTALGDALWRTEAGVELPGGGDARTSVDEVLDRLVELGITAG
jgi:aminoglycoside phosphotransferase (APT) family kinase protein